MLGKKKKVIEIIFNHLIYFYSICVKENTYTTMYVIYHFIRDEQVEWKERCEWVPTTDRLVSTEEREGG